MAIKNIRIITVGTLLLGILIAFLTLRTSIPSTWRSDSFTFHRTLADSSVYTTFYVGAALLFTIGIQAYKAGLRAAFRIIVCGMIAIAVGLAQLPIIDAYNLDQTVWVTSGLVLLPFLFSGLAMYVGMRRMARLVGLRSRLYSSGVVAPILIITIFLATLLPHAAIVTLSRFNLDVSVGAITWDIVLYLFAAIISLQVQDHIGMHYTNAMAWLTLGLFLSVAITVNALLGALTGYATTSIFDLLVIVSSCVYIKAGYAFVKTREL